MPGPSLTLAAKLGGATLAVSALAAWMAPPTMMHPVAPSPLAALKDAGFNQDSDQPARDQTYPGGAADQSAPSWRPDAPQIAAVPIAASRPVEGEDGPQPLDGSEATSSDLGATDSEARATPAASIAETERDTGSSLTDRASPPDDVASSARTPSNAPTVQGPVEDYSAQRARWLASMQQYAQAYPR